MVSLQAAVAVFALSNPGQTVLLDFYGDFCPPCRAMEPTIQALIDQGYPVRKINRDRNPATAQQYGVRLVPCYVMLVDGKEVDRVVGGTTLVRLKQMFQSAAQRAKSPGVAAGIPLPPTESSRALSVVPQSSPMQAAAQAASPGRPTTPQVVDAIDWRGSPPGWTRRDGVPADPDAGLLAASVRLRIEDADGYSYGSGTIVDARQEHALILTCAHIFRDSQGKGPITVDLFGPQAARGLAGRLISWDLDRDVALVCIRALGSVTVARVAPSEYRIASGAAVVTVGCNNGDRPSARHTRVVSVDRYQGPPNFQVAGVSVDGRSGGGVFSADGRVIGVCNAADEIENAAYCAALAAVHAQLDAAQLSDVYRTAPAGAAAQTAIAAATPPPMPKQMPSFNQPAAVPGEPAARAFIQPATLPAGSPGQLGATQQAALDEIRRRLLAGEELIIVTRSPNDLQAKSDVIMLSPPGSNRMIAGANAAHADDLRKTRLGVPHEPAARAVSSGSANEIRR